MKKDIAPQISPLEKRLQDLGAIRDDGSDKFFGMENVSVRLPQFTSDTLTLLRSRLVRQYLLL